MNPSDPQIINSLSNAGIDIALVIVILSLIFFMGGGLVVLVRVGWAMVNALKNIDNATRERGKHQDERLAAIHEIVSRIDKNTQVIVIQMDKRHRPSLIERILGFEPLAQD